MPAFSAPCFLQGPRRGEPRALICHVSPGTMLQPSSVAAQYPPLPLGVHLWPCTYPGWATRTGVLPQGFGLASCCPFIVTQHQPLPGPQPGPAPRRRGNPKLKTTGYKLIKSWVLSSVPYINQPTRHPEVLPSSVGEAAEGPRTEEFPRISQLRNGSCLGQSGPAAGQACGWRRWEVHRGTSTFVEQNGKLRLWKLSGLPGIMPGEHRGQNTGRKCAPRGTWCDL